MADCPHALAALLSGHRRASPELPLPPLPPLPPQAPPEAGGGALPPLPPGPPPLAGDREDYVQTLEFLPDGRAARPGRPEYDREVRQLHHFFDYQAWAEGRSREAQEGAEPLPKRRRS